MISHKGIADFEERAILDDDVEHMEDLKVGEIFGERDQVGGVF